MSLENKSLIRSSRSGFSFTLRDGLTWSDGQPVTAGDFEFAWKRAASVELAADYGYMFEVVDGTWAETYDVLIAEIKSCTDNELRYQLMHVAEDMLMETGCIVPLYFYTDMFMVDDSVNASSPTPWVTSTSCTPPSANSETLNP